MEEVAAALDLELVDSDGRMGGCHGSLRRESPAHGSRMVFGVMTGAKVM